MAGRAGIPKEYFTLKELSVFSGLNIRYLRDALKNPDHPLPHFRLNNKTILVSKTDFAQWLEQYRAGNGDEVDQVVNEIVEDLKRKNSDGGRPSEERGKYARSFAKKSRAK